MTDIGEEIVLLPYSNGINDNDDGDNEKAREATSTDHVVRRNEGDELRDREVPLPVPPQPVEAGEPGQPEQLPESSPHYPQPSSTLRAPEAFQIIATGLNPEMQQYASSLASEALTQFPNHVMAIARHIMVNFEERYGPPWGCTVSDGQLGFSLRQIQKENIMSDAQAINDPDASQGIEIGNAQIIASGMDAEKQRYAVQCGNEAVAQHSNQNMAIAQYIMSHFEEKYGPSWHCIVSDGSLGFFVRYDPTDHIYFSLESLTVFLFKHINN
ncbi:unnamed protein product [Litomosoides sigmodontis]|uniref:Dynein light chain n=1 Tax=Litomosoides sigmodontis TaxID=42156 RepID=A0A3P6UHX3_LITSI|nr:unnamed protein product [Litomosoides sigmodontis]